MNRDEIEAARRGMGLTMAEAARLVRVSPATWSRWERGVAEPTGPNDERIRLALRKHAEAIGRARQALRFAGGLAVIADDPRALAAAGSAVILEGGGRIFAARAEAPPTTVRE